MYYLRTRPAVNAIQFTVDKLALKANNRNSSQSDVTKAAGKMAPVVEVENKENLEVLYSIIKYCNLPPSTYLFTLYVMKYLNLRVI